MRQGCLCRVVQQYSPQTNFRPVRFMALLVGCLQASLNSLSNYNLLQKRIINCLFQRLFGPGTRQQQLLRHIWYLVKHFWNFGLVLETCPGASVQWKNSSPSLKFCQNYAHLRQLYEACPVHVLKSLSNTAFSGRTENEQGRHEEHFSRHRCPQHACILKMVIGGHPEFPGPW